MGSEVVSITEALGSGAPAISQAVGERLGIPVVDREVLLRAAQQAGVSPETIEQAERAPSFLTRMLEWLGRNPELEEPLDSDLDLQQTFPQLSIMTSETYRELIGNVIRSIADAGGAVIVGHGSHVILKEHPNALRVFLNAPLAVRAARISQMQGLDLAAAEKFVRESDVTRRTFFEQQYNIRRNEAQNYDLCLRTEHLSFETCAEVICLAATQLVEARTEQA